MLHCCTSDLKRRDQIACAENIGGEREIPDHPLTNQTISDCLNEAMDIQGLERLLGRLESGEVRVIACDLTQPSPLALEALSARPYAFLDDAPLEERRTQAVMARRWHDPQSASELGRLDPQAIARVRSEAWPDPTNAEELHDALLWLGCLTDEEVKTAPEWNDWLVTLARENRVVHLDTDQAKLWVAAERLEQFAAVWPQAGHALAPNDASAPKDATQSVWSEEQALVEILRGRLEGLGPVAPTELATALGLEPRALASALTALEVEGSVLRGRFVPGVNDEQWCDRRLLARIHHYTVQRLRSEIEPVAARDFLRFLFAWHHVSDDARLEGPDALPAALASLEGFEAPANAWETEILPARIADYDPSWLDGQCLSGQRTWARLLPPRGGNGRAQPTTPVRATPIAVLERRRAPLWLSLVGASAGMQPSPQAQTVLDRLATHGASFFDELVDGTHMLRTQVEEALAELVALGLVNSDSFGGLRALLVPSAQRRPLVAAKRRGRVLSFGMESAGRWSLIPRNNAPDATTAVEHVARALLRRYGVVFWRLLAREGSWLPPWRDLLRVYRRLEARGEIRGGRFVAGFSGEQYALPEAVGLLRKKRRERDTDQWVSLSGADPLNLVGILTPGLRLPALTGNRVVYRDGIPVAVLAGGKVQFLVGVDDAAQVDNAAQWEAQKRLLRSPTPPTMADLA
jgi:ATP-dependent helicase Lhr and Lhr-like helicase